MRAWRLYDHRAPHARRPDHDPLSGEGGLHAAGRWHHRGVPIVYAAASPALALLEVLVHVDPARMGERTLVGIELDDDVERVSRSHFVQLLRDAPEGDAEARTRDFGTAWAREGRSLALVVPSLVLPVEDNVIVNPRHPRAGSLRVVEREIVTLDARLLRDAPS